MRSQPVVIPPGQGDRLAFKSFLLKGLVITLPNWEGRPQEAAGEGQ